MSLLDDLRVAMAIATNPVADPAKQNIVRVYLTRIAEGIKELEVLQKENVALKDQIETLSTENLKLKASREPARTKTTRRTTKKTEVKNDTESSD